MKTAFKRLAAGLAVAVVLLGGMVAHAPEADARQKVFRSDDGKLVLVCYYDDRTGALAFCDVFWFPLTATTVLAKADATRLDADQLSVQGKRVVVDGGLVAGAPDAALSAKPAKDPGAVLAKGGERAGKHRRR